MAEIERFVNTAASAGGDGTTNATEGDHRAYHSLNEWEAAEETDLVTAGNTHLVHCEGTAADTAAVAISGWLSSAICYITIRVDSDKRHSGEWDDTKHRLSVTDTDNIFAVYEDYVNIIGLQIELVSPTSGPLAVIYWAGINALNSINFTKCIIRGADDDARACEIVQGNDADAIVKFRNCLVYNAGHATGSYGFKSRGIHILENVTVANCWICIRGEDVWTETNVLCDEVDAGNALYTWYADASHTRTYSASNDDKADDQGGAGNQVNQTFTYSSGYLLASDDAGARDLGTDLSGQGYSDDIAGNTRTGSWDIGCSEYVAAGGFFLPVMGNEVIGSAVFGNLIVR